MYNPNEVSLCLEGTMKNISDMFVKSTKSNVNLEVNFGYYVNKQV